MYAQRALCMPICSGSILFVRALQCSLIGLHLNHSALQFRTHFVERKREPTSPGISHGKKIRQHFSGISHES